jgi:hypothetical protein
MMGIRMDHPVAPVLLFHRDGMFYPVELPPDRVDEFSTPEKIAEHAALNPGTTKVTDWSGIKVLWAVSSTEQGDLAEKIEGATDVSLQDMMRAIALARMLHDDELLNFDPFSGDDSATTILDNRIVRGRREHVDQYTMLPIRKGERHRVLKEVDEGQFLTTRHNELTGWLSLHGYCLTWQDLDDATAHAAFIELYREAQVTLDRLEAEGRI